MSIGEPTLNNSLKLSKYSFELSGKVFASSLSQPTIIISAPMLSAYDAAIDVKTVYSFQKNPTLDNPGVVSVLP